MDKKLVQTLLRMICNLDINSRIKNIFNSITKYDLFFNFNLNINSKIKNIFNLITN